MPALFIIITEALLYCITCLVDDNNNNLWIGTSEGLNVMDKRTGEIPGPPGGPGKKGPAG